MNDIRSRVHVSPFGKAMDAMRVSVSTPNEQVFGEMTGWYDVRIWIAPGYAERVGDRELATQFTRVARLLLTARMREYRRLLEQYLQPNPQPLSASRRAFREGLDVTTVTGSGADGAIEVVSVGLAEWTVTVAPGTVERLGGELLGVEATRAANRLVDAWLDTIARMKAERVS